MKSLKDNGLLLIIPLTIFALQQIFLQDIQYFFMSWVDPIYAYLFNGLDIAKGNFDLGHVDHPGTPLQCLAAVVIGVVYLFRSTEPLYQDVINNSEIYIFAISNVIIVINCITIFYVGKIISKVSKNLIIGCIFQLTPVISMIALVYGINVMTESILVFSGLWLVLLSFLYLERKNEKKLIIGFSIVSGLSLAVKISSFPILFVPFLLINKLKYKGLYLLGTILSFLIFISPILPKISNFFRFLQAIFTHTGAYGHGDEGFIKWNSLIDNFIKIFTGEIPFTLFFISLSIVCALLLLKKIEPENKIATRLLYGIWLATVLQILMVAKHYSYHYLLPVHSCMILGWYAMFLVFQYQIKEKLKIINNQRVIIYLFVIITFALFIRSAVSFNIEIPNRRLETLKFIEKYEKMPRIIISNSESAYQESALYFGTVYAGGLRNQYFDYLKKKFPDSYFYSQDENRLYDWQLNYSIPELLSKYPHFLIYYKDKDANKNSDILKPFILKSNQNEVVKWKQVYNNSKTSEAIYELTSDTAQAKNLLKSKKEIFCDLEVLTSDNKQFIDSTKSVYFQKGEQKNSEKVFSGKTSIKLTKALAFGMDYELEAKPGMFYEITAWRLANKENGLLVAASKAQGAFYQTGATVKFNKPNGWQQIQMRFKIPDNFKESTIIFYLWNNGETEVFFDDIRIKQF